MKKRYGSFIFLLVLILSLTGCSQIGAKEMSASVVYWAVAIVSFALLIVYVCLAAKKSLWYLLLFSSVLTVSIGYLSLSLSKTLDAALLSNRLAYLGSVFLPLAMLMIILNVTNTEFKRWLPICLFALSVFVRLSFLLSSLHK